MSWKGREPVLYEHTSNANSPAAAVGDARGHGCYSACSLQWTGAVFLSLTFKPAFSLFSLSLIKKLFSSSSLYTIRVVSSAYLRLLFLPAVLIPACGSSSMTFHMMCSTYKLNKLGNNIQPWCTPCPILNQFVVACLALTVVSCPAGKVICYSSLFKNFPQFFWST